MEARAKLKIDLLTDIAWLARKFIMARKFIIRLYLSENIFSKFLFRALQGDFFIQNDNFCKLAKYCKYLINFFSKLKAPTRL